jgi:hypothetical protein
MSRGRKPVNSYKQVTVHLDEEMAQLVDRTMIDFGLDSKSAVVQMMIRAWGSAMPVDAITFETTLQSIRELRKHEFEALSKFYDERAQMYRPR